jgi:hypothetical protein
VPVLYLSLKDKKVEEKSETPKEEIPVKENNTNN